MTFEHILTKALKRKIYSIILGILYVFISYGIVSWLFSDKISEFMIFLITLLFVPSLSKILSMEERIGSIHKTKSFVKNHRSMIEIFLFLFIGIFIGYIIIGNYSPISLSSQTEMLEKSNAFAVNNEVNKTSQIFGILTNNIEVIIISFVLSIFFGAGALFLLVRTASVFAAFVIKLSAALSAQTLPLAGALSLHFLPEIFGFILASIAGGVLSKAINKERIGSPAFRNVVKDSSLLLLIGLAFIIIAALIEVFVSPGLVKSLV